MDGSSIMSNFISDEDMMKMEESSSASGSFISDEDMMKLESKPSELDSVGRGLAQGASFGLRDEAAGALESPLGALKSIANKFGADFTDEDLDAYKAERDASRQLDKTASETNPKSYMGGQLGGAAVTALIPGVGGASLGRLAAQGAIQGLGSSEGEGLVDNAKDATLGAGIGAAGYGLGKGIGAIADKTGLTSLVNKATNKVAGGIINTADDIANPFANLPGASHSTLPGKVFGASNKVAQVADAVGNIPENFGAGIRETVTSAANKDVGGALAGLAKSAGGGKGGIYDAVTSAGKARIPNNSSIMQRLGDTAVGAAAIPGKSVVLPAAAGAKAIGAGLNAANEGVRKAAVTLSQETIGSLAPKLGKYGQVLLNASQRGGQSLASTHFILSTTDPEYQSTYKQATEGDDNER